MFRKLKDLLLYASVGKETYKKIKPSMAEYNRRSLMGYSGVACILVMLLYILSFFVSSLSMSRGAYIACIAVSAPMFFIAKGPGKGRPLLASLGMNIFECMILGVGIALGTFVDPNHASMSFTALMFATPLLFASAPLHINLLTIFSIIIYTIIASRTQSPDMLAFNVSCVYPFGALSIIATTFIRKVKISGFVYKNKAELVDEITALNRKLDEARRVAESSSKAKTTFLNNMSHDIRTPMNAILGFADLMEKKKGDPEVISDYLEKIKGSGEYLLTIINNTLDLARIDSGKVKVDESMLDMTNENVSVIPMFDALIKQKHLQLYGHQKIEHKYLWCDIAKVNQIMVNLLSNAVKYTPEGGHISYTVDELPSDREGYAYFVAKVSDDGIGMSKDFLEHIFDDFSRERNTTQSKVAGTGLGMSIVKRLVDLLGYDIHVESEPGKGSTFTLYSYMKIVRPEEFKAASQKEEEQDIDFSGKRILLAEDNELNAEIAIAILEETGITVEVATDGVECVKMLSDNAPGYYDAILMDIQMPNLNGYEATQRIRHLQDKSKANIPILAMTANAFEEDKQEAFRAGMNGHISKPIDVNDLLHQLAKNIS